MAREPAGGRQSHHRCHPACCVYDLSNASRPRFPVPGAQPLQGSTGLFPVRPSEAVPAPIEIRNRQFRVGLDRATIVRHRFCIPFINKILPLPLVHRIPGDTVLLRRGSCACFAYCISRRATSIVLTHPCNIWPMMPPFEKTRHTSFFRLGEIRDRAQTRLHRFNACPT